MNIFQIRLKNFVTVLAVFGTCFVLTQTSYSADDSEDQGVEVQTRGPVHEAFAGVVVYNPEPGVIVSKAPPEAIEEVPPDEKPEGDNVVWIPGYWAWDDERNDFLWISGVWRALPPGRQWLSGYWAKTAKGYQWTSGYWADARVNETTYLPPPPTSIERGPSIDAPSPDYIWGARLLGLVWQPVRVASRLLGAGRPDWDWCPAYYSWTPRGYVYIDGYWDYRVERRGCLFAPVYFRPGVYVRSGFYYSPRIVIDLAIFPEHLFLRPNYHHCYFGDYYGANYYRSGFYASFSFQSRRYGYDPIYTQRRWDNRNDHGWESRVAATYKYRRDHEDARPPRTWIAQSKIVTKDRNLTVAASFDQFAKRNDSPVHYQPVAKEEKQQIVKRDQEIRQSRDERRTLESNSGDASKGKTGRNLQPTTAKFPQSPITSPAIDQRERDNSPPTTRQSPRQNSNIEIIRGTPTGNPDGNKKQSQPDQSQRRDSRPAMEQPARREAPPQQQQQQQAPAQQPSQQQQPRREAKPEKQRDGDNGEGRGNGKGDRNKDDDQQWRQNGK